LLRSYSPLHAETSVDVPPMSKPISRSKPAFDAVSTMPTTPAAGPDRMLFLPRKLSARVSPPLDCMKSKRSGGDTFSNSRCSPLM
jgi:hypothetical protein